ncbi:MAG: cation-translocating P-type ATPase, partial [Caldisericales bacterium]|nr:cation-translocating P-type ATPase [Caldisericales bacterium]
MEFRLSGLSCPDCAKGLEKAVSRIDGVDSCRLVFSASKIIVEGTASREVVAKTIKDMGYEIVEEDKTTNIPKKNKKYRGFIGFIQFLLGDRDTILALIGFVLVFPGLIFDELFPFLGISTPIFEYMAIAALIVAGYPVVISAFKNLFINHEITMNLLMVIAGVGGIVIGAYTEAGLVMVLFMIGEALEGYTMEQSRDAIRKLMEVA